MGLALRVVASGFKDSIVIARSLVMMLLKHIQFCKDSILSELQW